VSGGLGEEAVEGKARVSLVAVGVEDAEAGPSSRRAEVVPGDHHLCPLAHDVPPEPDPRSTGELEAQPGRFGDRLPEGGRAAGRLEEDEEGARPPGERGEPVETVRDAAGLAGGVEPRRQIHHEQVHRPAAEESPRDRQALVEIEWRDDDEPRQADTAGDRLDRVEGARDVQPRDDRAGCLRLGRQPQSERRLAARAVAAEREAGGPGHATRAQDRVERREAGRDDTLGGRRRRVRRRVRLERERGHRERTHDVAYALVDGPHPARSCGTPARLEGREGGRDVRGELRHRTVTIEQVF